MGRKEELERKEREEALEMARREAEYEEAVAIARKKQEIEARQKVREEMIKMMKPSDPLPTRQEIRDAMKAQEPMNNPVLNSPIALLQPQIGLAQKTQSDQRIPEPTDIISEPCLEVFKDDQRLGRHALSHTKQSWTLGRALDQVDIMLNHESISRKHAMITRQGMFLFVMDLGSAHGTTVDGKKIEKNSPARLCSGAC